MEMFLASLFPSQLQPPQKEEEQALEPAPKRARMDGFFQQTQELTQLQQTGGQTTAYISNMDQYMPIAPAPVMALPPIAPAAPVALLPSTAFAPIPAASRSGAIEFVPAAPAPAALPDAYNRNKLAAPAPAPMLAPAAPAPMIAPAPIPCITTTAGVQYPPVVPMVATSATTEGMMANAGTARTRSSSKEEDIKKMERIDKRRKRCKENSRKIRAATRNLESTLQLELVALQKENERLKAIVKQEIPDKAQEIIGECCYKPRGEGYFHGGQSSRLVRSDFELIENLTRTKQSFVLTDPRLPDNPIVFASCAFYKLTGYTRDQVMGRNCRFLQGVETDSDAVKEIRDAIQKGKDGTTCLVNYKADGTTFLNHLFVAALRDREHRIVNYVGVQSPVDKMPFPNTNKASTASAKKSAPLKSSKLRMKTDTAPQVDLTPSSDLIASSSDIQDTTNLLDWAEIAEILEADNASMNSSVADGSSIFSGTDNYLDGVGPLSDSEIGLQEESSDSETSNNFASMVTDKKTVLEQLFNSPPREFVTRTVRSELIDVLLQTNGDVTDKRFLSALDVLSKIFKSSTSYNTSLSSVLNGSWRSISRPSYHDAGCLGKNERGDFVYTLGKMCFNMFKPGNARVTVQETMNNIKPVGQSDDGPSAAPWSLRRELAAHQDPESLQPQPFNKLKSYDIAIAMTIEPGQFASPYEVIASPPCRLKAMQIIHGYFLPDPETPNRLTVWFTGGELTPVDPTPEQQTLMLVVDGEERYGSRADWIEYFGAEHKRTWGETLAVMGAKLFLGAELPEEMDPSGTMTYTLHRPYGGHGKGYADVLYVDDSVLITKGNSHTIHVMVADS